MAISIGSARLNDLGLGGASGGNESIVGTRTSVGLTGVSSANAVDAGDVVVAEKAHRNSIIMVITASAHTAY